MAKRTNSWFTVDKEGLAQVLERRGKAWAVLELLQNALDTDTKRVDVQLITHGSRLTRLVVEDQSTGGFRDLAHAHTLFAPSEKKTDATKRGRFNLGEKLVLALAEAASVASSTGGVVFGSDGVRRVQRKSQREVGTRVEAILRMGDKERAEALAVLRRVLVPEGVEVTVNNAPLPFRAAAFEPKVSLPTEVAGEDGVLRRSQRLTTVRLVPVGAGEAPYLYELGLPLVPLDPKCPFHIDVQQKVPTSMERDEVSPAYLAKCYVTALNEGFTQVKTAEDATAPWVRAATAHGDCTPIATRHVATKRFGEKAVAYDPSDVEANNRAVAEGYTVVHGGSLSAGEWTNVKAAEVIRPAGQVTPSPKPFSPDGRPPKTLDPKDWPPGVAEVVLFATKLHKLLFNHTPVVVIADDAQWGFNATYGVDELHLNVGTLGRPWFTERRVDKVTALMVHEFAHRFASNHLDAGYHRACTDIAGRVAELALKHPELFNDLRWAKEG